MSKTRKHNKTGRGVNTLSDFVAVERYIMRSAAWHYLTPLARAAYLEIAYGFDGANNGRIQMAARTLGDRLNVNKATASRALLELASKGFITVAKQSAFSVKLKQASEYRLTAYRCDRTGDLPSKEFIRWQPEEKNTVAPTQPHGCTHATEAEKRRRKQTVQLHPCNREATKQQVHGCTHAPLLKSTIPASEKLTASATAKRAHRERCSEAVALESDAPGPVAQPRALTDTGLTPLRDILDMSKLIPSKMWPPKEAETIAA
jgi:hypothetical protein